MVQSWEIQIDEIPKSRVKILGYLFVIRLYDDDRKNENLSQPLLIGGVEDTTGRRRRRIVHTLI